MSTPPDSPDPPPKAPSRTAREERLAAALRQNLKRRKDAARAAEVADGDPKPSAKPDPDAD